jgi:hypothetical protein
MRLLAMAMIVVGCGLAVPTSAQAQTTTVRGELITVMCFIGNGDEGRGDDHAACALKCASEGYPLAILTESGELYKVTGRLTADKNAALRDLIAEDVVAEGTVGEEGNGKTLEAQSVKRADGSDNAPDYRLHRDFNMK